VRLPREVRAALEAAPVVYLATSGHGVPNVVPVGFFWLEGAGILLADVFFGKTSRNLASNPAVALTAVDVEARSGFQVKGRATVHRHGESYERVAALLRASAGPLHQLRGAVVIEPTAAFALDPGRRAGARLRGGSTLAFED
jgi:predicted pyridoxine 5'-phosphate oxidase superfamily flavin-nucleotide-binding protein